MIEKRHTNSSSIKIYIPDASENPFIYRSSSTPGLVFVVFGAILGGILLLLLVVWVMNVISSRRNAKRDYFSNNTPVEKDANAYYNVGKQQIQGNKNFKPIYQTLYTDSEMNSSFSTIVQTRSNSSMNSDFLNNNATIDVDMIASKNSFISPTAELLSKHKSMQTSLNGNVNNNINNNNEVHETSLTNLSSVYSRSDFFQSSSTFPAKVSYSTKSNYNRKPKTTPSDYLDKMFEK